MRKRFFFHYNKPASKQEGKPVISVHFNKTCHLVNNVVCECDTEGKINKRQPFFVMQGKAQKIEIKNKVAYIT